MSVMQIPGNLGMKLNLNVERLQLQFPVTFKLKIPRIHQRMTDALFIKINKKMLCHIQFG